MKFETLQLRGADVGGGEVVLDLLQGQAGNADRGADPLQARAGRPGDREPPGGW
jgi:hypothetical protein